MAVKTASHEKHGTQIDLPVGLENNETIAESCWHEDRRFFSIPLGIKLLLLARVVAVT